MHCPEPDMHASHNWGSEFCNGYKIVPCGGTDVHKEHEHLVGPTGYYTCLGVRPEKKLHLAGKTLYAAGAIASKPLAIAQADFRANAVLLEGRGYNVLNPFEIDPCKDGACIEPFDGITHAWECYLKYDIAQFIFTDGVALQSGWEESPGARLEFNIAKELKMAVHTVEWWVNNA